jgi:septal ring factor EnvC (AmiA/AmiB activator)
MGDWRGRRAHRILGGVGLWLACGAGVTAATLPSAPVFAASPASEELEHQAEIEQLTAEFAAQTARERNLLDGELEARYDELEAKDRDLRRAEAKAAANADELAKVRQQRSKIAKQRKALSDELAARDRQLAAQVAAFREAITKVAGRVRNSVCKGFSLKMGLGRRNPWRSTPKPSTTCSRV